MDAKHVDYVAERVKLAFCIHLKLSVTLGKCCANVLEDAAISSRLGESVLAIQVFQELVQPEVMSTPL